MDNPNEVPERWMRIYSAAQSSSSQSASHLIVAIEELGRAESSLSALRVENERRFGQLADMAGRAIVAENRLVEAEAQISALQTLVRDVPWPPYGNMFWCSGCEYYVLPGTHTKPGCLVAAFEQHRKGEQG